MDLFRSKKRGSELASLGDVPESLQKRHRNMSGSVDELLDGGTEDSQDEVFSDISTSESEIEDVQKASKMQKIFAKKLIKRDKRKEKEHRKKMEKNLISMDDFLGKQSEFKMWLYEEKSKNAGCMSSPKLKTYFKQFVRLWNKHKLMPKYYKSSTLPESPRTPLTPKDFNFLTEAPTIVSGPLATESTAPEMKKEPPTSPFVTFGKTPPKVFKSKKLQLFSSDQDVALISVAPLESSIQNPVVSNKENPKPEEPCQYRVPSVKTKKYSSNELNTPSPQFIGATPYKVSVFSWAVGDTTDGDPDQSLCTTDTPPNMSHADQEDWPPPPTERELNCQSTSDSPHVPPPPPPRVESLPKSGFDTASVKSGGSDYSDPYDKLSAKSGTGKDTGDYQDPVDCIATDESKNMHDVRHDVRLVLKTFNSSNDEPDSSMYCKPVSDKRLSKEELEELYAKPVKKVKKSNEKPVKDNHDRAQTESDGGLYAEIMAHLGKKKEKIEDKTSKLDIVPDPLYASIGDLENIVKDKEVYKRKENLDQEQDRVGKSGSVIEEMKKLPEFAGLTKNKKKTVLAASSDKIYETYLSLGRAVNPLKNKQTGAKQTNGITTGISTLRKRHKSQPDISFCETIQLYERTDSVSVEDGRDQRDTQLLSSFKPIDSVFTPGKHQESTIPRLNEQQKAQSCEDNLGTLEAPRTPIIMSTPSFDSLCQVTPLSNKSRSSQSLPTKSVSSDNLSGSVSFMSTSTNSSLSIDPNEHTGSVHSLHSDKSLSPVPEETERKETIETKVCNNSDRIPVSCVGTLTPGKLNAAKHGIDLSVYLLKPTNQNDKTDADVKPEKENGNQNQQTNCKSKVFDAQSRLAIKETLSGLKTKIDSSKSSNKMEMERRHTVQTIQEMKEGYIIQKKPDNVQKSDNESHVPNIGLAAKVRKFESGHESSKSKWEGTEVQSEVKEPMSKRHCGEKKIVRAAKDNYLETDIDSVIQEKPKPLMRRSKSHSGFGSVTTNNVVTDIW